MTATINQTHQPPRLNGALSQSSWLHKNEFINAMHAKGIHYKGEIIADGQMHRFETGKRGRKDGYYKFNGRAGVFGDWSRGIRASWSIKDENFSSHNKKQLFQSKKAAYDDNARKQAETSIEALAKWEGCSELGHSPYFTKKQVKAFGIRFCKEYVVIPVRDVTGKIWSLQTIDGKGNKRFMPGGKKKGCFHAIGSLEDGKPIIVVEGYATGASVYMATKKPTVIAFDAGNLEPVIEALKQAYPKSPLIIAGDDDRWKEHNTGRDKAEAVAQKFDCGVAFPHFKNTETQPTDFNDLHALEGLEKIQEQLKTVIQSVDWPEPKPIKCIKKELLPVISLPPSLIPEPYQEHLTDIAERMQCPLDYVAVGAIIVTASLIGAGCGVRPKSKDSWTVIPNLWGGIVGAPSTLKTPALKEIMRPLELLEAEARSAYEKSRKNYLIEIEACKATKEAIRKGMIKAGNSPDSLAMEKEKEKLGALQELQAPICKRYSTNDATIEKMHELLSQNNRGLLIFRDELMGLLASWDKEGHESDRSFYLEAWNGYGSKTTDRIGRGTIYTKNLCLSLLGTTQPSKLLSYFQKTLAGIENDGLIQRFQLLIYPDEINEWKLVDKTPNDRASQQVSDIMVKLAHLDFTQHGALLDPQSETPYFHFDLQAQELFYEWLTEHEHKLRNDQDEPLIIEHLAKYRKLMPSLALIFHLIDIASGKNSKAISLECVEQAAGWCAYLEGHARRIYSMALNTSHQAARNLARKIEAGELKGQFDMREIYRKQWSFLKTKEEVELACDVLEESGWIKETTLSENGRSKQLYLIHPQLTTRNKS